MCSRSSGKPCWFSHYESRVACTGRQLRRTVAGFVAFETFAYLQMHFYLVFYSPEMFYIC
uniref:Uncharacterized protein n=1 Tax=Anguilla anguilla TaxID=7936 RepID=A0A0E9SVS3_ANGAN